MSKKYVIDLPDDAQYILINGASENHCYTRVEQVDDLEELNSDYINENFGELQDEAYKRGYEDGKNSIERGCKGCKWESKNGYDEPCCNCLNNYNNQYKPMPKQDDRIEVGDEVENDVTNSLAIVTNVSNTGIYVLWKDGSGGWKRVEQFHKTGKHYDIASILEAMRK